MPIIPVMDGWTPTLLSGTPGALQKKSSLRVGGVTIFLSAIF